MPSLFESLHSGTGRINRTGFLKIQVGFWGSGYVVVLTFWFLDWVLGVQYAPRNIWIHVLIVSIVIVELSIVLLFSLIKRAHDLDRSGHLAWLFLIPWINLILLLYLLIKKGTDGPNQFGPEPGSEGS